MAKTKHIKYERVQHLPNVFFPEGNTLVDFPWQTGDTRGIILELGCGKGEHALALAALYPNCLVVGVDIKSHRLCSGGDEAMARDLDNLYFLRTHAAALAAWVAPGSVREIWITFPDPHPKQREIKHRLSAPDFLAMYATLLRPGGVVHLKTDSDSFYGYTLGVVTDWGGAIKTRTRDLYRAGALPAGAVGVCSAFEQKARAGNRTIKYLKFTLN
jgi:tRNA (guanine-N7-)-methyltransferase